MKKLLQGLLGLLLLLLVSPVGVLAQGYGSGSYGGGDYSLGETSSGTGSSGNNSTDSTPQAPACGDARPMGKTPWLYGALAQDAASIKLYFTDADGPLDNYVLQYGTAAGKYQSAVGNMGGKGTATYIVGRLNANTAYYFQVRAGNGCATGDWSNEISATTKPLVAFDQLEISASDLQPEEATPAAIPKACKAYTVISGDTLWSVAKQQLGDATRYQQIVDQNKPTYPALSATGNLKVGWKLKIDCPVENPAPASSTTTEYSVKVKVMDTQKKPVSGAKVTLHSVVQEQITNKEGIAQFNQVEPGLHRVRITYQGYQGEETVMLAGEVKAFDLNVTVKPQLVWVSPQGMMIIGGFCGVVLVWGTVLVRAKKTAV